MANDLIINHACISPKRQASESSRLVNTWRFRVSGMPEPDREALCPYPHTLPYTFLQVAYPQVYSSVITINVVNKMFPWVLWATPAHQSNTRKGSLEPPIYSQSARAPATGFWSGSRKGEQTKPMTSRIRHYLQVDSVKISYCFMVWTHPHLTLPLLNHQFFPLHWLTHMLWFLLP